MMLRHMPRDAVRSLRRQLGFQPKPSEELLKIAGDLAVGATFVDIGANAGRFSIYAAQKVGPLGHVLAIEANPKLAKLLRSLASRKGLANIAVEPVAVGEHEGAATLHRFRKDGQSSLYRDGRGLPRDEEARAGRLTPIVVPLRPLAAILCDHGIKAVDALKIDIEGYEDRALIPFFQSAPRSLWPQRLLIERSPHIWREDCIAFMRSVGYQSIWEGQGDTLLSRSAS
jgi:FkbM family methyltransferase